MRLAFLLSEADSQIKLCQGEQHQKFVYLCGIAITEASSCLSQCMSIDNSN